MLGFRPTFSFIFPLGAGPSMQRRGYYLRHSEPFPVPTGLDQLPGWALVPLSHGRGSHNGDAVGHRRAPVACADWAVALRMPGVCMCVRV